MLQNTFKTLGFQKIMVYKTPPGGGGGGGGKPYLARGLECYPKERINLTNPFHSNSFHVLNHASTSDVFFFIHFQCCKSSSNTWRDRENGI